MLNEEPVQVFKIFKEQKKGRPKTAILDSNGRNIKAIESRKRWASEHKEQVKQSVKQYIKNKNIHHEKCIVIINILKELINKKKITVPQDFLLLIHTL